ncbi:MAG TPA: hypothetical protein VMD31_09255 [Opitutaceae bacterium]|nr:hypothetical protein [Opitutaceae bacterium]
MNPESGVTAESNQGKALSRVVWVLVETGAGAYALEAVAGLGGEPLAAAGWLTGVTLILALAIAKDWIRAPILRAGWARELGLIAVGMLLAPLVPGWTAGWGERAYFILVARGLAGLLRWAARAGAMREAGAAEPLRLGLLFALAGATLHAYLTPLLVGPKDAPWYGNAVTDFLTQLRAGVFPVLTGATPYEFNGAVQMFRSAPWHLYLAGLVDTLTLRGLTPLAVEHVTLVASYLGAVFAFYLALVRLRPAVRWTAAVLAAIYASSPAMTQPLVEHDMYMTWMAVPLLVFVLYALIRACEARTWRAFAWVGAGCAALWLCHPPLALMSLVLVVFCLGALLAFEGPGGRVLAGAIAAALVFAVLAAPYFLEMSEIPTSHPYDPVPHLLLPGLALFLLILAIGMQLRRGGIRWLALLPTVGLTLGFFRPSLLPFGACFLGLWIVALGVDRRWPGLALRARPEPWLLVCFFAAAAAAAGWFPKLSLPEAQLAPFIGSPVRSWGEAWRLIIHGGDCQPHAVWWLLVALGLGLVWRTRARAARLLFAAGAVTIAGIFPVPLVKMFLWRNTTVEVWDALNVNDRMRFWPFALPLVLAAVFLMLAELAVRRRSWHRASLGLVLVLVPGALWGHARIIRGVFTHTAEDTARLFRTETDPLQNYGWDLLRLPSYWSSGVMDYRLETRLWRQGGDRALLIGPDTIAREMEQAGAVTLDLLPARDPSYPQWIYFAPMIELRAGEHKLLRFDFLGRKLQGWLILRGGGFYRDYALPSSGYEHAFGSGPGNTRTLSIWNSSTAAETIELVLKREGPEATAPVPPGTFARVTVSRYDPARAPIEVKSLVPLVLRVEAPAPGVLELFRNSYPGYRIDVNGRPVRSVASREGLVAFAVPAGGSEVFVRFRGTWLLRACFWAGLTAWSLVALALGAEIATAGRRPGERPGGAGARMGVDSSGGHRLAAPATRDR